MAEITKSVIGKISGTLGNMVFRNIGGKVVIYTRPHNQKISFSKNSVNNRGKFGLSSLLAKNARLLPGVEEVWESSNEPGRSAYTKLIKANSKSTDADKLTLHNKIVPIGYSINVIAFLLNNEKFEIEYNLKAEVKEKIFAPYNANLMIFLYDLINPGTGSEYYFLRNTLIQLEDKPSGNTILCFDFQSSIGDLINLYNKAIVYFTLVKVTDETVNWTSDFKSEIIL
jgi:hypothetical protein